MISFVIGALVTVFTFYIALIYASVTIGLLGFAEAILLVLAFLLYRKVLALGLLDMKRARKLAGTPSKR